MVDRWLEDSGIPFGCEEVGPINVVDPSAIRKAGTLAFVGIEDEAAVDSFDAILAVYPRRLAFNGEGFGLLRSEGGKQGQWLKNFWIGLGSKLEALL
jgi:hypothetical protein